MARTDVESRARPVAHFTARRGWVNDPYGVRWDGRRYHMCYQAVPDQTAWSPACAWGHAVSGELVSWEERSPALVPQPHEAGCWSGCVVDDPAGAPRAFYTRVQIDDLELGAIAAATFDQSGRLVSGLEDVVVAGPPEGMPITTFRDPFVWRDRTGWTMIVGAGTANGAGAVLQYRSPDLDHWQYTGMLCSGRVATDGEAARQVWECPQMVQINGSWVLVVSVAVDGRGGHVAATAGGYDGARFVPHGWQRLAYGTAPYATSVFRDREGRPCMISWLQEDAQHDPATSGWAGAQSLVSELAVDSTGRVTATPHSGLATSRMFANHAPATWPWIHDVERSTPALATRVSAAADSPAEIQIRRGQHRLVHITRSPLHDHLAISRAGRPIDVIPGPDSSARIEIFIDADILEIFSGGHYGAWRLPPFAPTRPLAPPGRG